MARNILYDLIANRFVCLKVQDQIQLIGKRPARLVLAPYFLVVLTCYLAPRHRSTLLSPADSDQRTHRFEHPRRASIRAQRLERADLLMPFLALSRRR